MSNGGGAFAAILLSVPLSAVALMSVFGIPQLTKIVGLNHSDDEGADIERGRDRRGRSRKTADTNADLWDSEADADSADDELDESTATAEDRASGRLMRARLGINRRRNSASDFEPDEEKPDPLADAMDEPAEDPPAVTSNPFSPRKKTVELAEYTDEAAPAAGKSKNFADAVKRLGTLGVSRYHLEPGLTAGSFLFVCLVDSETANGEVHRFEAEARDPQMAVDDVIRQVSSWKNEPLTRTAGVGRP
jgi:hypothetical protein